MLWFYSFDAQLVLMVLTIEEAHYRQIPPIHRIKPREIFLPWFFFSQDRMPPGDTRCHGPRKTQILQAGDSGCHGGWGRFCAMTTLSRPMRAREPELPPKVHAAISFIRLVIGDMAMERMGTRWPEGRVPGPLENAVYDGALLVLLEFFEAPDLRNEPACQPAENEAERRGGAK